MKGSFQCELLYVLFSKTKSVTDLLVLRFIPHRREKLNCGVVEDGLQHEVVMMMVVVVVMMMMMMMMKN